MTALDVLPRPARTIPAPAQPVPAADRRSARRTSSIVVLIPAHDEAATIAEAVTAVRLQEADRVIVVTDNCTDDTADRARAAGAEVFETVGNTAKKAGALNQALAAELPHLDDEDYVFVQDADSILDPGFLGVAAGHLAADPSLGGVGGTFRGGAGGGVLGMLQRNEYARYGRDVRRLKGKVLVLTGTATLFRVSALRAVLAGRAAGILPASHGVYDETVLTEDNELSQAILHLGYQIRSPKGCTLETEVMLSWRDLYHQRLRWKRGAVENLLQYGLTRITARYWGRQFVTAFGCLVTAAYLASIAYSALAGGIHLHPLWMAITVLFCVERAVSVRDRGWKQMALGATVVAEMPFDIFLQCVHVVAYSQVILRSDRKW